MNKESGKCHDNFVSAGNEKDWSYLKEEDLRNRVHLFLLVGIQFFPFHNNNGDRIVFLCSCVQRCKTNPLSRLHTYHCNRVEDIVRQVMNLISVGQTIVSEDGFKHIFVLRQSVDTIHNSSRPC